MLLAEGIPSIYQVRRAAGALNQTGTQHTRKHAARTLHSPLTAGRGCKQGQRRPLPSRPPEPPRRRVLARRAFRPAGSPPPPQGTEAGFTGGGPPFSPDRREPLWWGSYNIDSPRYEIIWKVRGLAFGGTGAESRWGKAARARRSHGRCGGGGEGPRSGERGPRAAGKRGAWGPCCWAVNAQAAPERPGRSPMRCRW